MPGVLQLVVRYGYKINPDAPVHLPWGIWDTFTESFVAMVYTATMVHAFRTARMYNLNYRKWLTIRDN